PESAGEAAFADAAFHKRPLTALAGWGVVFTGIVSTATVTGAVLLFATTLHTVALATITSTITLVVFCVVNASLLRLKLSAATTPANATTYPRWVPAVGLTLSVTLLVLQFVLG
ncbi:MAG: hypothetical protein P8J87_08845, partial [Verrucomicrobiales bacterium]|nr:hypothetical protein [Verrucomicrobiales bacterium]